jgi:hypothetical protein
MKGQKPKEVGNTTLANGAGQVSVTASASLFSRHIPVCNLPTGCCEIEDAQAGKRLLHLPSS